MKKKSFEPIDLRMPEEVVLKNQSIRMLNVIPIKKTLEYIDKNNVCRKKRVLRIKFAFAAKYDNQFVVGGIYLDQTNHITYIATKRDVLSNVTTEVIEFSLPKAVLLIGSSMPEETMFNSTK